jgi:ribosomal protein S18 acetylase RimI-like enzyme
MPPCTIRPYEPADRPALIALVREMQRVEAALFDRMKPPDEIGDAYLDALLLACARHGGAILVAIDGRRLIGYAAVLTAMSSRDEIDEIEYSYATIRDLAVAEAFRRRGVGRALLARCEDLARVAGARWLRITTLSNNAAALRAYERAGFAPLLSVMEKTLDG